MKVNDFCTDNLTTDEQRLIAKTVMQCLPQDATGGGCQAFYTPQEWIERKEDYGTESKLILCHDGGDVGLLCSYDRYDYDAVERFRLALEKIGYYVEQCTGWYSAVYPI